MADLGIDKQAILSRRVESLHGPLNDAEQVSASAPVAAVVVGPVNTLAVRERMILRAYLTKATTGMNLTRVFAPTVKGFNETYGARCRSWDQVAQVAHYLMTKEG